MPRFESKDINPTQVPPDQRRGRGALSNEVGRFERFSRENFDDGWGVLPDLPSLRTEVRFEKIKKVITANTSPDLSFDRSFNPYRGCEHGCIYCFARPSHGYLGYSAGLDFETKLLARPDAPERLVKALSSKSYTPKTLAIGTNTDPYQPIEKEHKIMRRALEVLAEFKHPVAIVTKGVLVERDIDILSQMARDNLVRVGISITSLDAGLSRRLEPRVPSPQRRLKMIERLAEAGIEVHIFTSPIIPGLTDSEVEKLLQAGSEAGAVGASWALLRLPYEVSGLFQSWLAEHVPERAAKVMSRVREAHGGKDYDAAWGKRMRGEGVYASLIAQRWAVAAKRLGLVTKRDPMRCDLFHVPERKGDQLSLF
ncbi:MAG: PA0069 family radical SAM protein [Pseudomonadota bacterium]